MHPIERRIAELEAMLSHRMNGDKPKAGYRHNVAAINAELAKLRGRLALMASGEDFVAP